MRIVSLSPSLTDILEALGLSEDLVGVTEECTPRFPVPQRIGGPKTLDTEKILALKPDLIFADKIENRPQELKKLEASVKPEAFVVNSVASLISVISQIGKLTDRENEVKPLVQQIYEAWPASEGMPVRTVMLHWNNPFLTFGPRTYAAQLLEAAGGQSIFQNDTTYEIAVEFEDTMEPKPELVILLSKPFAFESKDQIYFKSLPAFADIPVRLVEGDLFLRYGPKTVRALKVLREIIQEAKQNQ